MILLTGATGFIGKNLVPELAGDHALKILVRKTSDITLFRNHKNIKIVYGDLEKNMGIDDALNNTELVIHCAARTIARNYIEYYRMNTLGTTYLVQAMKKEGVKKILYLSSQAACGPASDKRPLRESATPEPISFYGKTKKHGEEIIIRSGLDYIILRPAAVYGPYDTEILKYIKILNRGVCPIIGRGEKYVNFIYIKDLVQLIIRLISVRRFDKKLYFVNDGNCYSDEEIFEQISSLLKKKSIKIHISESTALLCGLFNDLFLPPSRRLIWRDKVKELSKKYWLCSNEKINRECGFTPAYTFKDGMRETIEWYRKNGLLR